MKTKREELDKIVLAYGELMLKAGAAEFPLNVVFALRAATVVIQYNKCLDVIFSKEVEAEP